MRGHSQAARAQAPPQASAFLSHAPDCTEAPDEQKQGRTPMLPSPFYGIRQLLRLLTA